MKKVILSSFFLVVILSFVSCGNDNSGCDNSVTSDEIGTNSAKIEWSHSCLSCEEWEIIYDRNCFFCWFPLTQTVSTGGNAFQSFDAVITGLSGNTDYKATIRSVGAPTSGQPCTPQEIGTVYFRTN